MGFNSVFKGLKTSQGNMQKPGASVWIIRE
jgi:hypothetical protein